MPTFRPSLGDNTERYILSPHGYIEYRYGPGGTCEIVNIEVHPDHRRQGVGRKLVEDLFVEIKERATTVYAITRAENEVAQEFYEKLKFRVRGVLRRFYSTEAHHVDAVMYGRGLEGPV